MTLWTWTAPFGVPVVPPAARSRPAHAPARNDEPDPSTAVVIGVVGGRAVVSLIAHSVLDPIGPNHSRPPTKLLPQPADYFGERAPRRDGHGAGGDFRPADANDQLREPDTGENIALYCRPGIR